MTTYNLLSKEEQVKYIRKQITKLEKYIVDQDKKIKHARKTINFYNAYIAGLKSDRP